MKKIKKIFPDGDLHLWIASIASFVSIILVLFCFLQEIDLWPHSWKTLMVGGGGFLSLLLIFMMTITYEGKQAKKQLDRITSAISKCDTALNKFDVCIKERPSQPEHYSYLWGRFAGIYYVYNPSYKVDEDIKIPEIVKIFINRYKNPDFKEARYMFLIKDTAGQNALKTFSKIMRQVKKEYGEITNKIEVRVFDNRNAGSEPEMYLGDWDDKPRVVLELKEPFLDLNHGFPNYYLVINADSVVEHYKKTHFEIAWNSHEASKIDIFSLTQ